MTRTLWAPFASAWAVSIGCILLVSSESRSEVSPLEVTNDFGQVAVEWQTSPGILYELQTSIDLESEWANVGASGSSDGSIYGLGQPVSIYVHEYSVGGSPPPTAPELPSSTHTFTVAEFTTQGKMLVSWPGENAGQALVDRDQLPDGLPPIFAVDADDGIGGFYSLTVLLVSLAWQDAYLADPNLATSSLSTEQQFELARLLGASSDIEDAIDSGELDDPQQGSTGSTGAKSFYRLRTQQADSDKDGVPDSEEFAAGIDAFHPDTDRDGFLDSDEIEFGSDPANATSTPTAAPGSEARFQTVTILIEGDPSVLDVTASHQGVVWNVIEDFNGPGSRTITLTRGVEYNFYLGIDQVGEATIELIPIGADNLLWWAQMGDDFVEEEDGNGATGSGQSALLFLLPLDMAFDVDRNLNIDFTTDNPTSTSQFRFWTNTDSDSTEYTALPQGQADSIDNKINTKRDLEDFTRLWIKIGSHHDKFTSGEYQLGFKIENAEAPSIKLYQHREFSRGYGYLYSDDISEQQLEGDYDESLGTVLHDGSVTYVDKKVFEHLALDNPIVSFLVEGASPGFGDLVLVVKDLNDGTSPATESDGARHMLRLFDIRALYERAKTVPPLAADIGNPYDFPPGGTYAPPSVGYEGDDNGHPYMDDPEAEKTFIVFVHGWKSDHDSFLLRSDTLFKRCWQAGYTGKAASFNWPTGLSATSFVDSEYRARVSGAALKAFVESLPSDHRKLIVSHSLGAVVVASALEEGMIVEKYFPVQAAVPAMTFDGSLVNFPSFETPDTSPLPEVQALGAKDRVPLNGVEIINYPTIEDPINGDIWEANNGSLKPYPVVLESPTLPSKWYTYDSATSSLQLVVDGQGSRDIDHPYESVPFVVKSRSWALGTTATAGRSVFENRAMDFMGDILSSSDVHNSTFKDDVQFLWPFYSTFVEDLNE